jgi:putative redox protein
MTSAPEGGSGAAEALVLSARLESTGTPHGQRVEIGRHALITDEPPSHGGGGTGPSPVALLVAALAGCTAITLEMYAARKGWALGTVRIDLKLFRAGDAQRIQRTIGTGAALTPEQRSRLLEIADKTPVTKMLKPGVTIATSFRD